MTRPLSLLLLLALLAGCDLAEETFRPEVVVEGTLIAGQPMGKVRLSQSAPVEVPYSFEAFALSGATVRVALLAADGSVEEVFPFQEDMKADSDAGTYRPTARPKPVVLPNRRYRLEVEVPAALGLVPAGTLIRAETTVPDTFRVARAIPDTLRYDIEAPSPPVDVSLRAGPRQGVFIFNVRALAPALYPLTPTAASFVENGALDPERAVVTSSPLLNEANYERLPGGALRLRVPWYAISYFGPNAFTVNALDDALYDFLRSRDAQFNPTTLSPGEIQRVLSNVENGIGVFGSLAQADTVTTFIAAP